ncbi:hypothetical protein MYCTH_89563 [Thermothelomyces thermophilus ATCC 42464]|uniref:DNA damage-inducible protein 1 n=1 Tax=Thermothelomyces thermophilus (strain ATCC 42464 / BCRC 31852 / DSM 1799) TaxID=573729 RepID=G2Q570_THET4|nr:uncharacterized protein MYCTH_89563 [Thermothelomyces thermophilus ATCC 42464]AEO55410.1 hypothetical protein MYCTH_89563 [Thermothelomyces thermophilus ATCC 42464]
MTIETLRSSIQAETTHHPSAQHLYHNGQLVSDNSKTLAELGVTDGDMLALHVRDMRGSTTVPAGGGRSGRPAARQHQPVQDPEVIRLQILGDPNLRGELARSRPDLVAALEDPQRFARLFADSLDRERREREERQRQIQLLNSDPFDVEAQAKIEEIIRQERVMENLQNAMEHNPEAEVPFLGPADIPTETEEAYQQEPTVPGPAGTTIGQRSGAVHAPSAAAHAAQSSGGGPSGPQSAARPSFPREHIDQLMALGASEQRAIQALEATGGNVEYAASLIFQD